MFFVRINAMVFGAAVLLSACSKAPEAPVKSSTEVRGEPIHGEAIAKTTNSVVAGKTNGIVKACDVPIPKRFGQKDFVEVGFDKLAAYTFEVPDGVVATNAVGKSESQIPAEVKAYDQKKVQLKGFMLPLKVDDGLVTEMLIMKDQSMCCYGSMPRINDWVSVKMGSKGVPSVMDQPVTVYGKLHVGEMLENGYLVGIYELEGEKMDKPN